MMPTRDSAWDLLNEYTSNPNLIKHALAVESAMRAYAEKFGEDPDEWGVAGLIHDFDYDRFPEEHPRKGVAILSELGYPEEIVHAVKSHADFTGTPRDRLMDRTLFAVDELCGFITAATLVRPDKRIAELSVRSVKKRMKDKAFARAVSREDLRSGAGALGIELDEHIGFVIAAMTRIAGELGLDGKE
ncbi:MAG: HDIG domain-containing protein [Acidobacteriota bacterium]|jgi:putative nucleotidyltransferase with HDIG domain